MDSFAGIEAFAAVVERGSFTAAAASLQTAKSSVSETVRALEERMGVRLLERTTRKVRPTEAGLAFYRNCRRLLDDAASARNEAQAAHKQPTGRLRVGAPDGFAERHIVPGLPAFLAAYPAIEIHLVESAAAADLIEGGLDLAIRIVEKPEPHLVVRRIATSRVVIVASPGYLAAAGTPAKPRDILHHRLVGFAPLAWRDTWRLGKETIAVQPATAHRQFGIRCGRRRWPGSASRRFPSGWWPTPWSRASSRASWPIMRRRRSASTRSIQPTACSPRACACSSTISRATCAPAACRDSRPTPIAGLLR